MDCSKTRNFFIGLLVLTYLVLMIYYTTPLGEYYSAEYNAGVDEIRTGAYNHAQLAYDGVTELGALDLTGMDAETAQTALDNANNTLQLEKDAAYTDAIDSYVSRADVQDKITDLQTQKGDLKSNWEKHAMKGLAIGSGIYSAWTIGRLIRSPGKNTSAVKLALGLLFMTIFLFLGFTGTNYGLGIFFWTLVIGGLSLYTGAKLVTSCSRKSLDIDSKGKVAIAEGKEPNGFKKLCGAFVNFFEHGKVQKLKKKSASDSEIIILEKDVTPKEPKIGENQDNIRLLDQVLQNNLKLQKEIAELKKEARSRSPSAAAATPAKLRSCAKWLKKEQVPQDQQERHVSFMNNMIRRRRLPAMENILTSIQF